MVPTSWSNSWLLNCFVLKTSGQKTKQLRCSLVDQLDGTMFIERLGLTQNYFSFQKLYQQKFLEPIPRVLTRWVPGFFINIFF